MDITLVSCPYNPAHQVLRSRIQAHIIKCEKNYPKLEICPFNATHRFPESELRNHILSCPSRIAHIENRDKALLSKAKVASLAIGQMLQKPSDSDDECWD